MEKYLNEKLKVYEGPSDPALVAGLRKSQVGSGLADRLEQAKTQRLVRSMREREPRQDIAYRLDRKEVLPHVESYLDGLDEIGANAEQWLARYDQAQEGNLGTDSVRIAQAALEGILTANERKLDAAYRLLEELVPSVEEQVSEQSTLGKPLFAEDSYRADCIVAAYEMIDELERESGVIQARMGKD